MRQVNEAGAQAADSVLREGAKRETILRSENR
jgi:hypothetical protein